MWEGEMGRNPALGAPGSNTYAGLIASSTNKEIGSNSAETSSALGRGRKRSLRKVPATRLQDCRQVSRQGH